jgi:hypothetical protein
MKIWQGDCTSKSRASASDTILSPQEDVHALSRNLFAVLAMMTLAISPLAAHADLVGGTVHGFY